MRIRKAPSISALILLATTVATLFVSAYWWFQKPADSTASLSAHTTAAHLGSLWRPDGKGPSLAGALSKKKSSPVNAGQTSIRERMKTEKDWYALAKEILPKAQAGMPEAQYVLYRTSQECHSMLGAKSKSSEEARDEAMRVFPNEPQLVSKFEAGYVKCHGLFTADAESLGDPWNWLQKATDAGYPAAQAQTAVERMLQDRDKAYVRAGDVPSELAVLAPIGGDANPRDLLALAVQSADPEVLMQIGSMLNLLSPKQSRSVNKIESVAWQYVACQRGYDCSSLDYDSTLGYQPFGSPTAFNCGASDGPCTPVPGLLMAKANYDWAPVQEQVDQINAALNSKQWDKLPGLSPGG